MILRCFLNYDAVAQARDPLTDCTQAAIDMHSEEHKLLTEAVKAVSDFLVPKDVQRAGSCECSFINKKIRQCTWSREMLTISCT